MNDMTTAKVAFLVRATAYGGPCDVDAACGHSCRFVFGPCVRGAYGNIGMLDERDSQTHSKRDAYR